MAEMSDSMPLFVRVDGYRLILQDLEAIKQILENMDEAVQVLNQVERVKEKSIRTFNDNVERLETRLNSVNDELPTLEEASPKMRVADQQQTEDSKQVDDSSETKEVESAQNKVSKQETTEERDEEEIVEDSINNLHSRLKGLKDQLDNL